MLTLFYGLGLAAMTFLLAPRVVRFDWHHAWAVMTRPPVHHPAGYLPPRLPTHVKLPPAPVAQRAPRIMAWHGPSSMRARRAAIVRSPRRRAKRVYMAQRSSQALPRLAAVRVPQRAPLPRRVPKRAALMTWAPQRAPMPTWAHPPDPTLPPECRPRNPVVVGQ